MKLTDLTTGVRFYMGSSEQIWQVTSVDPVKATASVIAEGLVASRAYHEIRMDVTWNECSLRQWLNQEYYKTEFTDVERQAIRLHENINPMNLKYRTRGGFNTQDHFYLPSLGEITAMTKGGAAKPLGKYWWLRSSGLFQNYAAIVNADGTISDRGHFVDHSRGVRPMFQLDMNSDFVRGLTAVPDTQAVGRLWRYQTSEAKSFGVGTVFTMGTTPASWRIFQMDTTARIALAIAEKTVVARRYHDTREDVTWERSDLRAWLNTTYYQTAFTEMERRAIVPRMNINPMNLKHGTLGGKNTTDRVWILNLKEAETYFPESQKRSVKVMWWLRSAGLMQNYAALVDPEGTIQDRGNFVDNIRGVRPVVILDLDSELVRSLSGQKTEQPKKTELKKTESKKPIASQQLPVKQQRIPAEQQRIMGTLGGAYTGTSPFIFVSYAHKNTEIVEPIIRKLQKEGYHVWYDTNIELGSSWDEDIASHVEDCHLFIAMISKEYLESDNCKDELNFARDENKKMLLIYLDDSTLSGGMRMRLGRLQALFKNTMDDKEFYERLYTVEGIQAARQE